MNRRSFRSAFTLVELLVVIGIIAVLMSILLPSLSRARASAQTIYCLNNLRQIGIATQGFANDNKGYLPYPTTTQTEAKLWYNVIDSYLSEQVNSDRSGVAGGRSYTPYKQCLVWQSFEGGKHSGSQDALKEFSKSYKWNSMLRRFSPYKQAKITDVHSATETVLVGDGLSLDQVGPIAGQWENGQFSMEVNDKTQANPALRHNGAANIAFVDGHAESVRLTTIKKTLRSPQNDITVESWESEFVDAAGNPSNNVDRSKSIQEQGLRRNPRMPLIWSQPGTLYR